MTVKALFFLAVLCGAALGSMPSDAEIDDMTDRLIASAVQTHGEASVAEAVASGNTDDILVAASKGWSLANTGFSAAVNAPGYRAGTTIRKTDVCKGIHVTRQEAMLIELPSKVFNTCASKFASLLQVDSSEDEEGEEENDDEEEGDEDEGDMEEDSEVDLLAEDSDLETEGDSTAVAVADEADADADDAEESEDERRRRRKRRNRRRKGRKGARRRRRNRRNRRRGGRIRAPANANRGQCAKYAIKEIKNRFPGDNAYAQCLAGVTSMGTALLQTDEGEEEDASESSIADPEELTTEAGNDDSTLVVGNDVPEVEDADILTSATKGFVVRAAVRAPTFTVAAHKGGFGGGITIAATKGGGGVTAAPGIVMRPPTPPPAGSDEAARLARLCAAQRRLRAALYAGGKIDARRVRKCVAEASARAGGRRPRRRGGKGRKGRKGRKAGPIHIHIHGINTGNIRALVRDTVRSVLVDFYRARLSSSGRSFKPAAWSSKANTKMAGFDPYNPASWSKP